MAGESFALIGRLLGRRRRRTTASYAHLTDTHLIGAADRIGVIIFGMMQFDDC